MDKKAMAAFEKLKSAMSEFESCMGPNLTVRDGEGDETTGPDLETVESSSSGGMDKKALVGAIMKKKMGM